MWQEGNPAVHTKVRKKHGMSLPVLIPPPGPPVSVRMNRLPRISVGGAETRKRPAYKSIGQTAGRKTDAVPPNRYRYSIPTIS